MPRTRFWAKPWTNGLGRARSGRTRTGGTVSTLNVDVDLPDQRESVIVSMDLVKQAIEKTDHIGTMNKCLRREADGCAHYPHDLTCLFLSKSGRVVVQHGIAREVTKEEALARVDRAVELEEEGSNTGRIRNRAKPIRNPTANLESIQKYWRIA